mmetsp:Transcript_34330/g.67063  ORF Transcript_34330/g.67063 Transcript_34330/m.67063 type:complete len:216 (+) Transcript_34330:128-775(+)
MPALPVIPSRIGASRPTTGLRCTGMGALGGSGGSSIWISIFMPTGSTMCLASSGCGKSLRRGGEANIIPQAVYARQDWPIYVLFRLLLPCLYAGRILGTFLMRCLLYFLSLECLASAFSGGATGKPGSIPTSLWGRHRAMIAVLVGCGGMRSGVVLRGGTTTLSARGSAPEAPLTGLVKRSSKCIARALRCSPSTRSRTTSTCGPSSGAPTRRLT